MEILDILGLSVYAQETPAAAPQGGMNPMLGIVLMMIIFFALVIWPQSRKAKKQAEFLSKLQKGDAVVTQSGLYGRISGIADKVITLEISNKVFVRVDRQAIAGLDPYAGSATEGTQG